MPIIKQLTNRNLQSNTLEEIYPKTSSRAVYDVEGNTLESYLEVLRSSYTYGGTANLDTVPSEGNLFYIANAIGTYNNFDGRVLDKPGFMVLVKKNGSWESTIFYTDIEVAEDLAKDASGKVTTLLPDTITVGSNTYANELIVLPFNSTKGYDVNDLCSYHGLLWRFTKQHRGEWNYKAAMPTTIGSETLRLNKTVKRHEIAIKLVLAALDYTNI